MIHGSSLFLFVLWNNHKAWLSLQMWSRKFPPFWFVPIQIQYPDIGSTKWCWTPLDQFFKISTLSRVIWYPEIFLDISKRHRWQYSIHLTKGPYPFRAELMGCPLVAFCNLNNLFGHIPRSKLKNKFTRKISSLFSLTNSKVCFNYHLTTM